MYDKIEKIGKSTIQHGKYNDRIYLMKLDKSDYPQIIEKLDLLAAKFNYPEYWAYNIYSLLMSITYIYTHKKYWVIYIMYCYKSPTS